MEEIERLFRYKKTDILIRKKGNKFQIGLGKLGGLVIWLEKGVYDDFEVAIKSGAEYGRIVIEHMEVQAKEQRKKEIYEQEEKSQRSLTVDREKLGKPSK